MEIIIIYAKSIDSKGGDTMTHSISLTKKVGLFAVMALLFGLVVLPTATLAVDDGSGNNDDATDPTTIDCSTQGSLACPAGYTCGSDDKCQADSFGLNPIGNEVKGKLGNRDLRETAANLINVLLGLLGLIAVVIVLAGGFKWMTAGGSEDKIGEARKMIFSGVIGLAIILSAWAISLFVINQLSTATGGTAAIPTDDTAAE